MGRIFEGPWDEMRFDLNPGKRRSVDSLGRGNRRRRAMTWWFLWQNVCEITSEEQKSEYGSCDEGLWVLEYFLLVVNEGF